MKTSQDFPTINERPPEGIRDDGTKYRIMVVDDSMFVAKQLGQILTSEGYDVVATAVDGKDGLDKYKELAPNIDLVTMDITMPTDRDLRQYRSGWYQESKESVPRLSDKLSMRLLRLPPRLC